jgi:hypothetical protein
MPIYCSSYTLADDGVLRVYQAIAKAIGRSPRQVYHLAEAGLLPIKKVGKQLIASRKQLLRAVIGDESPA